jgi:hypothetical protein
MELKSYEMAKESLEFLIKANDSQLVSMAKNSTFLRLTRKIFFETTLELYHAEWSKVEVRILWWIVERVLDITFDIYLFRENPIHLLEYIEGRLRWHPVEFRKDLIEMLNYSINDAKRFPKRKVNVEYINQQLKDLKSSELSEGIILDSKQASSFFGVEEISIDEFYDALTHSNGSAMTEEEEINILMKRYVELTGGNILTPQPPETKTNKLKAELGKYGFFELPKVKQLSEPNKQSLIELIRSNPMPYGIAMFDELGFCEYLDNDKGSKYKANEILSRLYNEKAKDGTSAKHYRRSLIKPLARYKAGEYKETVKTDYQRLK